MIKFINKRKKEPNKVPIPFRASIITKKILDKKNG